MYCHIHHCHYHHCNCGPKDNKENGKALTQEELLALTQEMKQELKDYTVDLKDQIFSYIDIGLNPVEVANTFASLKEQDTYILRTLTNKIDDLNNSTNLSFYNLKNRVTSVEQAIETIPVNLAYIHASDYATIQEAVNAAGEQGGGTVYVPSGKYEVNLRITHPNVHILGDGMEATHLYASGRGTVVEVSSTAEHTFLENMTIHGYLIDQEDKPAVVNEDGVDVLVENTSAAYSLRILSPKFRANNISVNGARFDSVYISAPTGLDSTPSSENYISFENFYFGPSARQPLSIIQGFNLSFVNGVVYHDHSRAGRQESGLGNSIYFVDFEPNSISNVWGNVLFRQVTFESHSTAWGGKQIVLNDCNLPEFDAPNIRFETCKFLNGVAVRGRAGRERDKYHIYLQDVYSDRSLLMINGGANFKLKSSVIKDCIVGTNIPFWAIRFGEGSVLDNIRYKEGIDKSAVIGILIDEDSPPTITNVEGQNNRIQGGLTLHGDNSTLSLKGRVTVEGDSIARRTSTGYLGSSANPAGKTTEVKFIDVSDTSKYTELLIAGQPGSTKVTITGQDSSSGEWSFCVAEAWIVCSSNSCLQAPINYIINDEIRGADIKWHTVVTESNASLRGVENTRKLLMKPRAAGSNQYMVTVESFTQYTYGLPTWLIQGH